jgi:hypothetical protein
MPGFQSGSGFSRCGVERYEIQDEGYGTKDAEDIAGHVQRMEKPRKRADLRRDSRKYLMPIPGVVVSDSVKNKTLKNGFFVLVPLGDTFAIIKPEGKYHVRE